LRQLLEQVDEDDKQSASDTIFENFPDEPAVEFKLGRLGIGYDEGLRVVTIFAYQVEDEEDAPPAFSCQASLRQCASFADLAESAINAGRPICVLCGAAIDINGHQCLRRNGHSKLPVSLE
jgi:uncharacterized repeat protein (TIGR03847 family)